MYKCRRPTAMHEIGVIPTATQQLASKHLSLAKTPRSSSTPRSSAMSDTAPQSNQLASRQPQIAGLVYWNAANTFGGHSEEPFCC